MKLHYWLLLPLLLTSQLLAEDINTLLEEYRVSNDLSHQTKKESQGHVTVFTRDDLERMQAYKLGDVLKTIKTFTLQMNSEGLTGLTRFGSSLNEAMVRLYMNDHDIASAFYGSAMMIWGDMDIAHINHIEVYQGGTAISFGEAVSPMVIKLYTKTPERDSGSKVLLRYGSNDTVEMGAYHALDGKEYDFFGYVNGRNLNRDHYNINDGDVSRDFESLNLYTSLSSERMNIEASLYKNRADGFIGQALNTTVGDNENDLTHAFVTYRYNFLADESLQLRLAYDHISIHHSESTPLGFKIYDGRTIYELDHLRKEQVVTANLKKSFRFDTDEVILGIQVKYQNYDLSYHDIDGIDNVFLAKEPFSETLYSLYGDWEHYFNDANMLTIAGKADWHGYDNDSQFNMDSIVRIGYISLINEAWRIKAFAAYTNMYPSFKQLSYMPITFSANSELRVTKTTTATAQLRYQREGNSAWIKIVNKSSKDGIMLNKNNLYVNSPEKRHGNCYAAGFEHTFTLHDKVRFEYSRSTTDAPMIKSSDNGFFLRLFNRIGSIDFYNEIVWRDSYSYGTISVDAGYDYTAGASYRPKDDFNIAIKGENLLNRAIETPFSSQLPYFPAIEKRVTLSMEYLF